MRRHTETQTQIKTLETETANSPFGVAEKSKKCIFGIWICCTVIYEFCHIKVENKAQTWINFLRNIP